MISSNIPLNKLSNNEFKSLLEKYTNENISNETTLRKSHVDEIYSKNSIQN